TWLPMNPAAPVTAMISLIMVIRFGERQQLRLLPLRAGRGSTRGKSECLRLHRPDAWLQEMIHSEIPNIGSTPADALEPDNRFRCQFLFRPKTFSERRAFRRPSPATC